MDQLTQREILLIEELGIQKRLNEIHQLIESALVARLGGEAKFTHAELEHTRKSYILTQNIQAEDYTADILLRVRLK